MSYLRRILACLLGIASPSRIVLAPSPRTWLERWERRIDARVSRRMPEFLEALSGPRWILQLVDPTTGGVVKERDVTAYSHRSRRMRLNRWRRMQSHAGMTARLAKG